MSTAWNQDDRAGLTQGALSREQLRVAIQNDDRPLIADWLDLDSQLQPNGFDLTLRDVNSYIGPGTIGISSDDRTLPDLSPLSADDQGWFALAPGIYHVLYNEIVDLPTNLMALGRPRSSLGRCGVTIHTAVWDAGYRGRSTSLLSVLNPEGFRVQKNARVMQLVFFRMAAATGSGYQGRYQNENTDPPT